MFTIKETTRQPEHFFSVLPPDWQEGIVPFWTDYQHTAQIFITRTPEETAGGGIVFSTVSPDTMPYKEEAQKWADAGFLYIGFLWFAEKYRGKQMGSSWLQEVINLFPHKPFWLSVDDFKLVPFYERAGFTLIKKLELETHDEWILATRDLHC